MRSLVSTQGLMVYSTLVEAYSWWVGYCENDNTAYANACVKQLEKTMKAVPQLRKQIEELIQLIELYLSLDERFRDYSFELHDKIDMGFKQLLYSSAKLL